MAQRTKALVPSGASFLFFVFFFQGVPPPGYSVIMSQAGVQPITYNAGMNVSWAAGPTADVCQHRSHPEGAKNEA